MLPTQQLLEKVSKEIKNIPNRRGEHLRQVHYGCYLLCSKAGLRVSESVSFSLENKTKQGLYCIEKPKGKKERLVYVPKEVIGELKKQDWKPNQTNRWNFYHFLKKIKRELGISKSIELTPHTLRYTFTTYQAESGLPLPLLRKLLGHSSIRTTALYWQNIYQEPDNDLGSILAGKKWLENQEPPEKPSTENFAPPNKITTDYLFPQAPESPKPIFIDQKPLITNKKPIGENNSLSVPKTFKKTPQISINKISPRTLEKFSFEKKLISEQLPLIVNSPSNSSKKEQILLQKIKQLKEQLKEVQEKNNVLTTKLVKAEKTVHREKQRANNYHQQLKVIIKSLYQWKKLNYYKQSEQEQTAQIEQLPLKPPNK